MLATCTVHETRVAGKQQTRNVYVIYASQSHFMMYVWSSIYTL